MSQCCSLCIMHLIERKARRYIKDNHKLKKDQRVVTATPLAKHFAEHVLHVPVKIVKNKAKKTDVVISSATLNDCVAVFLESLFTGKKQKQTKELFLFSLITDQELAVYCTHHKILFKPKEHKLKELLNTIEKKHPGTMHSLYKSKEELKGIFY